VHTTLSGIFDAITHVLERYFSPTHNVECSSGISESLVKTLMKHADLVRIDPSDYNIRSEIMWACRLAMDKGIYLGRKGDWACHQIAHEIGALTDASHSEILSVLYPSWLEFVAAGDSGMMQKFAENIIGISDSGLAIDAFRAKIHEWGLPSTFRELGISDAFDVDKVAANCAAINPSGTLGNYRRINQSDISRILRNAG